MRPRRAKFQKCGSYSINENIRSQLISNIGAFVLHAVLCCCPTAGNNLTSSTTDYRCYYTCRHIDHKGRVKMEEKNAFPESKTYAGGEENIYTPHHDPNSKKMPALSFKHQREGFSWASHSPVKSLNAGKLHARQYLLQFDCLKFENDRYVWHVVRLLGKCWNPAGDCPRYSWNVRRSAHTSIKTQRQLFISGHHRRLLYSKPASHHQQTL